MSQQINKRPSPEVLKSRLHEIAKRYRKRKNRRKRTVTAPQLTSIRIAELNRLIQSRHGAQVTNDAAGRKLVLVVAHHLVRLAGHPQEKLMAWTSERAPWLTVGAVNTILATIATNPCKWRADGLAWHLGVTYAERTELGLTTIGATDYTTAQRKTRRRLRSKARSKAYRTAQKRAANTP